MKLLKIAWKVFKAKVKDQLHVCTTVDVWSTKARSFLGVTVHWIDKVMLSRESAALACRRFKGSHTYDRIAELLDEIHNDFGLTHDKIQTMVPTLLKHLRSLVLISVYLMKRVMKRKVVTTLKV